MPSIEYVEWKERVDNQHIHKRLAGDDDSSSVITWDIFKHVLFLVSATKWTDTSTALFDVRTVR